MTHAATLSPPSRRRLSLAVLAGLLAAGAPVFAQDAAAPAAAAPAGPNTPSPLESAAEDFWHYATIGRYDAAVARGNEALTLGSDPTQLLAAVNRAARLRNAQADVTLARWEGVEALKPVVGPMRERLGQGRYAERSSPQFITEQIRRLAVNQLGYQNGLANLRNSGELAVPFLLEAMRDQQQSQYAGVARRALIDLGREALNPLVAATEVGDAAIAAQLADILGEIGYADAAPYLLRLAQADGAPQPVVQAARAALAKLDGADAQQPAADAFLALAERFYYGSASVAADTRNGQAFVWYFDDREGLTKREVPPAVFGELMAMRANEYALALGPKTETADAALALWLTSNYKRQIELGESPDPTRAENQPDADYYGTTAGSKYLETALQRTLKDRDGRVAYDVVRSMNDIVGRGNAQLGEGTALVTAMGYPDRRVRFEAALATAASEPQAKFAGSDLVVPLLAEAVGQTGKPTALVVGASGDQANALAAALTAAGYDARAAASPEALNDLQAEVPAVDAVVVVGDLPPDVAQRIVALGNASLKLRGAAKVFVVNTTVSPYEELKRTDPLVTTTTAREPAEVIAAVDAARGGASALPMDEAAATEYASRAARALAMLGDSSAGVFDVGAVQRELLAALNDPRVEVANLVGDAAAKLGTAEAQKALLTRAVAADAAPELRVGLFRSLASSAQRHGNLLGAGDLAPLDATVAGEANLDVRGAAAEARGSLNLSADQAKTLVVEQSQK